MSAAFLHWVKDKRRRGEICVVAPISLFSADVFLSASQTRQDHMVDSNLSSSLNATETCHSRAFTHFFCSHSKLAHLLSLPSRLVSDNSHCVRYRCQISAVCAKVKVLISTTRPSSAGPTLLFPRHPVKYRCLLVKRCSAEGGIMRFISPKQQGNHGGGQRKPAVLTQLCALGPWTSCHFTISLQVFLPFITQSLLQLESDQIKTHSYYKRL